MDINKIQEVLPHRYPFLLIDRIISCEPDESVHAIKCVTINEPFFDGKGQHKVFGNKIDKLTTAYQIY